MQLLRITTAGSVDDGKSTLIGRLLLETGSVYSDQIASATKASEKKGFKNLDLSLLTDGLAAEREQNITIDVAYRYLNLGDKRLIIADVPGHEEYTKNMVTGASLADLALVLIDAKNGYTPQTQRHLTFLSALGIPEIVIVVNKMDDVEYSEENFNKVKQSCENLIDTIMKSHSFGLPKRTYIPVSALVGDMVTERRNNMPWHTGPTVLEYLKSVKPQNLQSSPARLPIQMVLRSGSERRYAGLLVSGVIETGQEIVSLPNNKSAKIMGIYLGEKKLSCAVAGQSIAVALDKQIDISQGNVLADPKNLPDVSNRFNAKLFFFRVEPTKNTPYFIRHISGNKNRNDSIVFENHQPPPPEAKFENSDESVSVTEACVSNNPLVYDNYLDNRTTGSFIIIDRITKDTIGCGMIQ